MFLNTALLYTVLTGSAIAQTETRLPRQPLGGGVQRLTFNNTVSSPRFRPQSTSISWISSDEDGVGVVLDNDGNLSLENFVTGNATVLVPAEQVPSDYWEYWIRSDLQKVLWATNYTKQYRYSYFANYEILDIATGELTPIVEDQAGDIQYAEFAPTGDVIAFVRDNNLYLHNNSEVTQITFNGSPDFFNGVPDWVYEEEIFGNRYALWWSPDATSIAYLSFNETGVGTFTIPYYMDNMQYAPPYPRELDLRYPKVGSTNPTVQFHFLEVESLANITVPIIAFEANNTVVGEVKWLTENSTTVMYRAYNRQQDQERHVVIDVASGESTVTRERDGTDGWLDNLLAVTYIGDVNATEWYLDESDASGWNHLYLFSYDGAQNISLTSGDWEVRSIASVDTTNQLVYYTSTQQHSLSSHLYSVSYPEGIVTPLVDDTQPGYYSASFSADNEYYLLSYLGPDVPYQELYSTNSSTPLRTVTNNSALYQRLQNYTLPNITYFELPIEGTEYTMNVMQRLPPNFDPSRKYPVLFTPYGGPGAQEASYRFQPLDFNAYIASDPELEYITYTVDGRGTGYKGRAFRAEVTAQLGLLEAQDQISAARQLVDMFDYIDADHVGIWGWSFGGYLAGKVVEADSGHLFSLGLSTAPVSDWRFYDTLYTERYMKILSENEAGYNQTAIRNTTNFNSIPGKFAIMHGTGDDNVHYQNTAALVDLLVGEAVSPAKWQMVAFTDSDHSIAYNGASQWIYRYLSKQLYEEKNRNVTVAPLVHQWKRRGVSEEITREVRWRA
ncbi:Dipeptidyl peptidase 4 [Lithohypha guttulata]|uniref:dipeptidyl-peptidase IV n=1 Tax=Lithohypha guttulata TaxID=1690604 RepID=A0AAN7YA63_9EURO|nr:Dipeptidyl peptidase 4 [Lithohypha guttulata]